MGEMRNVYSILVGNPEGKKPFGRPWCIREDNIKMDLTKIVSEFVDWMHLAQDRD
jgi:hypothetical protein